MDCCGKFLARQQNRACGFPAICEESKLQESHTGDCCYPSPIRVTLCFMSLCILVILRGCQCQCQNIKCTTAGG